MWATDVIFDVGAAANAEGVRIRRVTERLSDVVSFPRRRLKAGKIENSLCVQRLRLDGFRILDN